MLILPLFLLLLTGRECIEVMDVSNGEDGH